MDKKQIFLFEDFIHDSESIALNDFITVFQESKVNIEEIEYKDSIQSLLIPNDQLETNLSHQWLGNLCDLYPHVVRYTDTQSTYYPWGNELGVIPLIQQRFYNNIYPTDYKVLEEFILFHNLYEEPKSKNCYSVNTNSDQHLIVKYDEARKSFSIKTHQLRQFLSVKECHLLIQYDCFRTTTKPLADYDIETDDEIERKTINGNFLINFLKYDFPRFSNDSRLLGKLQISGYKNYEHHEMFNLSLNRNEHDFHKFIIAIDDNGNEILSSSNIYKNDTNYYKIVSFNRSVLQRYYEQPNLYCVEDGTISKKGSWHLPIDNNNMETVKAYLGDIGCLDKPEQSHWLAHNIISSSKLSDVQFKRDTLAIPYLEPEMPDLLFRYYYDLYSLKSKETFGFSIFKSMHELDRAYLDTIRVPLSENLHEFEKVILNLSKVLCDAIDIKSINKYLDKNFAHKIDALEHFIKAQLGEDIKFISALRKIQLIRSKSVAHNKDENYEDLINKLGYSDSTFTQIVIDLLKITSSTFKKWHNHSNI